jgi:hypothetical protein
VEAYRRYRRPVKSVAVYLRRPGSRWARPPYQVKLPDGGRVHDFWFDVVELCRIEAKELVETGLSGLLPLLPLTHEGQTPQTVERSITGLLKPGVEHAQELLWLTYGLSGLVLKKPTDKLWLKRRFAMLQDLLEESWTLQEFRDEYLQQGEVRGVALGLTQMRQTIVDIVQERFPVLAQLAAGIAAAISDLAQLRQLAVRLSCAQSAEEARQLLLQWAQ